MPRHGSTFIPEETLTNAQRMNQMVGASIRQIETLTTRRRSSQFIPEKTSHVKHRRSEIITNTPPGITRRTDDYMCRMAPAHTHPFDESFTNPEVYRCNICRRYGNSSFVIDGICGYCQGLYPGVNETW